MYGYQYSENGIEYRTIYFEPDDEIITDGAFSIQIINYGITVYTFRLNFDVNKLN